MPGPIHFKRAEMAFKPAIVEGGRTSICRAINADVSETMGAGVETLEGARFEWTVTYDEILFIEEGSLTVHSGGKSYACVAGDIVWLPNGITLVYDAPERCTYFYALYPVDWAARQGTVEP